MASRFSSLAPAFLALLGTAALATPPAHAQDLLVTSEATQSVLRYDGTTGAFVGTFASGGGLTNPDALAFGADGNLYVDNGDSVLRYNGTTGAFMNAFVTSGSGGLIESKTLAFGPDGSLYVASGDDLNGTPSVLRYDGTTGAFLGTFASGSQLAEPMSLAFGPDGNLYVGNGINVNNTTGPIEADNILRYNGTTGAFLDTFVPAGNGLVDPNGIVFGPDKNLYVSNEGLTAIPGFPNPQSVLRYDGTTGAFKDAFVTTGSGGIMEPQGLLFGPNGSLFVASGDTAEVYKYNGMTGAYQSTFVTMASGGLGDPKGLAFLPGAGAAVPEPSSLTLLGLGLAGLGGFSLRARKRRTHAR